MLVCSIRFVSAKAMALSFCLFVCRMKAYLSGTGLTGPAVLAAVSPATRTATAAGGASAIQAALACFMSGG